MGGITIVAVGKIRTSFIREGIEIYQKRLSRGFRVTVREVPKRTSSADEADEVLNTLTTRDFLIALDERGQVFTSAHFAESLQKLLTSGTHHIVFAVGGAEGWDDRVRSRANLLLSLSNLTFPHQLARLILMEQLYRADSIIRGVPYHKDG